MNKKVNFGISKFFISLIVLSTLMSSCVQGDLYDLYDDTNIDVMTPLNKHTKDYNYSTMFTSVDSVPFFQIAPAVLVGSGCVIQSLHEKLPFKVCGIYDYKLRQCMAHYYNDVYHFQVALIDEVLESLKIQWNEEFTISYTVKNANSLSVGDIAITKTNITFYAQNSNRPQMSSYGHAFVIDRIENNCFVDMDETYYCKMDKSYFQGGISITWSKKE